MPTRAERDAARAKSLAAHAARIKRVYGITGQQYWALYAFQGGKCAICQRATGATKRLAVDHDHRRECGHDGRNGCPRCVRGLLCGPCNTLLGQLRDNPGRLVDYLADPPFQKMRTAEAA